MRSDRLHPRIRDLRAEGSRDLADTSPADRLAMMWQLTRDAWTMMGEAHRLDAPFAKDAIHIHRRSE